MKKLLLFLVLIIAFTKINAQIADSIPNGDFEKWVFNGWNYSPQNWRTPNTQLFEDVFEDSSAYSGKLAMKMINFSGAVKPPIAYCGFKIQSHPIALDGYANHYC